MAAGTSSSSSSLPPPQHNWGGSLPVPGTLSQRCSDDNPSGNNSGRKAVEDKDLISELPDSIICEIFSFLPIEEIVRTSILSRHWRFIWTGTRTITFSCSDILCTTRIDRFLNQCTALAIQEFQISLGYAPSMKENIDRCISFALARGAKDMELNFSSKIVSHEPRGRYVLPGVLLSCRSIVRLHLRYCSLEAVKGCSINWGSLKALCIDDARLEGLLLDEILNGSPSLEHLELKCCFGAKRIRILSRRVMELVIDGHKLRIDYSRFNTRGDDASLEIYAPYLQSLRILGDLSKITSIKLNKVSSLVDVELNVLGLVKWQGEVFRKVMVKELLTRLGGVHKLAIGSYVLPVLRAIEAKEGCFLDLTCRQLTLWMKSRAEMWDLFGIAAALRCAPATEKLVVNSAHSRSSEDEYLSKWILLCYPSIFGGDPFVKPNGRDASRMANHLRSIEIFGHCADVTTDWKTWLPLVEFLLREALVLEEMTIHIDNHGLNSFSEEILGYVRGSIAARIIFIHPGGRTTSASPL